MSYPAPTLYAEPTGGQGELFVRIEGELRPVQLLSMLDVNDMGGEWTAVQTFPLPGLYRVSGFVNFAWNTLTAVHVNNVGEVISAPARPIKARAEPGLPSRAIEVSRKVSVQQVAGRTNAFLQRIKAWPIRGVTGSVFLYQREAFGSGMQERDIFIAVCKPGDLTFYPEGAPVDNPYFRLDYVDLLCRSLDERTEIWFAITQDVDDLLHELALVDEYNEAVP